MKIAQISTINGAKTDGNTMRVAGLSRSLLGMGQSVVVVCQSNSKRFIGDFEKTDVPLLRVLAWLYGPRSPLETLVGESPRTRSIAYRMLSPISDVSLRAVNSCSILHCHLHRVASLLAKKRRDNQRVLLDFHGMVMLTDSDGTPIADARGAPVDSSDGISQSKALRWQARIFDEADGISFVTTALRDRISELYDVDTSKTYVIPDGVDFRRISQDWTREDVLTLRRSWEAESDVVVMYVGKLDSLHGAMYLEEVIHEMLGDTRVGQSLKVIVAGWGRLSHEFADLQRKFRDRLVYLPCVAYEMLPTYLAAADILVVPHTRNLLMDNIESGKLLNYLASGKPTVVTSLASASRLLEDDVSSLLCNPDSPSAMVSKIERLANSPELRERIGRRGAELVKAKRDWSRIAGSALEVYNDLAVR